MSHRRFKAAAVMRMLEVKTGADEFKRMVRRMVRGPPLTHSGCPLSLSCFGSTSMGSPITVAELPYIVQTPLAP